MYEGVSIEKKDSSMTNFILGLPKPIAIVGMGLSGESAYRLLLAAGIDRQTIYTYDAKSPADFQNHLDLIAKNPKTLVVSPGVPLKSSWIQDLVKSGCFLTSEISLGASIFTTEKVVGITGSLGKSTTTAILGEIFKSVSPHSFAGGNLGFPLCDYAHGVLLGAPRAPYIALELSSYQLENSDLLKVDHSILTYLSPNHLERYDGLKHYYETKLNLLKMCTGVNIVNAHGGDAESFVKNSGLPFVLTSKDDAFVRKSLSVEQSKLLGDHNLDNLALAVRAAIALSIDPIHFAAALKFCGLPHRLEFVGTVHQIHFVNDSKATALDSVLTAVESVLQRLDTKAKVFLLIGGRDKNLPWSTIQFLSQKSNVIPLLFGECREKIGSVFPQAPQFPHLKEAIDHAIYSATANDFVLLSPGGTSMDEFKNFEERGRFFVNHIKLRNTRP